MNFPTTRWSLILASGEAEAARTAWTELAVNYRSSILAYFRCRFGTEQAEDLTHSFFAASISGGWWARADLDRGSFRTYLRMLLRRFGERHAELSATMPASDPEASRSIDEGADPEAAYDRDFARALVDRALAQLRIEYAGASECQSLLPFVLDRGDQGQIKRLAEGLGVAPTKLRQKLHRMRLRLRELLRDEFSQLVAHPALIDAELKAIQEALMH
jgi:DNA-directed RNA polymerase specialized sigma24 family protein